MEKTISLYLDDDPNPLQVLHPPAKIKLDTTQIADGEHTLTIRAISSNGVSGVKKVNFTVRNGPEISIDGLKNNQTVNNQIDLGINAYGSETQKGFIVEGSENLKAIPAWLWVTILGFVSWAGFYLITNWYQT